MKLISTYFVTPIEKIQTVETISLDLDEICNWIKQREWVSDAVVYDEEGNCLFDYHREGEEE